MAQADPPPGASRRAGSPAVVEVAVPSPLRRAFDYLAPYAGPPPPPGSRVRVPFGRRSCVGVVLAWRDSSRVPRSRLRRIERALDREPLLPAGDLAFLVWASRYFHHPVGEVVLGALPGTLRRGGSPAAGRATRWRPTPSGAAAGAPATLGRAPRQAAVLELLRASPSGLEGGAIAAVGGDWRRALAALVRRGLAEAVAPDECGAPDPAPAPGARPGPEPPSLDAAQAQAVDAVLRARDRYHPCLLDGVTGSGKTEVYLALIEAVVAAGRQALVLIPEIGLTPQIVARFRERLSCPVAVLHSGLPDAERARAWLAGRAGTASVVIGTRSAVFTPLARPGIFIVDEEHDGSFKQQDGFRYSARDLAVVRARRAGVPVVLGSATPSLETLLNARRGRYADLRLPRRAAGAAPPEVVLVDVRGRPFEEGLSFELRAALADTVARGEQALLFLNRRGYAPVLLCHACGWNADCDRCDAHMVYHLASARLRCHHCGRESAAPPRCPECASAPPRPLGLGTQRVAEAIARALPGCRVARVDRDSMRGRGRLEAVLDAIHAGEVDVLVGTQMLAKGHHFPNVTLVGILDADAGLFGADFRAPERMAQLLVQVSGRAGRGDRAGRVLVQTHHPHHPWLRELVARGYRAFAERVLAEREAAGLPPFSHHALLRAEASRPEPAHAFLEAARESAAALGVAEVDLLGPVPAPMERRAGRYRAQLLLEAPHREPLHRLLAAWLPGLEERSEARRVRWSVDVDPQEML